MKTSLILSKEKNMEIWNHCKSVPEEAKKEINGGRLKGMTDIRPQWRLEILTEVFGVCGFGWKYKTRENWTTDGPDNTRSVHVIIELFVKIDDKWSDPIEGQGGSMVVSKELSGLYHTDEAYKMATTDAISVACKQLGIGADVYMGYSNSKYKTGSETAQPKKWAIDFSNIQKELSEIEDMQILKEYHTELMAKEMSDKQKYRVNEMFAERKKEIGVIQKIKTEVQGTIVE